MKFQVGPFTCELSRDDNGKVRVAWQPEPPKYLNAAERRQYRDGCAAFDLAERLRKFDEPPPEPGASPRAARGPPELHGGFRRPARRASPRGRAPANAVVVRTVVLRCPPQAPQDQDRRAVFIASSCACDAGASGLKIERGGDNETRL